MLLVQPMYFNNAIPQNYTWPHRCVAVPETCHMAGRMGNRRLLMQAIVCAVVRLWHPHSMHTLLPFASCKAVEFGEMAHNSLQSQT
jgi:hypothetical protein